MAGLRLLVAVLIVVVLSTGCIVARQQDRAEADGTSATKEGTVSNESDGPAGQASEPAGDVGGGTPVGGASADPGDGGVTQEPSTSTGGGDPICDCADGCSEPRCQTPQPDGSACGTRTECMSGHCEGGLCCSEGQCCTSDTECGAADDVAVAVCEDTDRCQGSRGQTSCEDFRCVVEAGVEDDSACDPDLEAHDCGPYLSVFCNGQETQEPPVCPGRCAADSECDEEAHCNSGRCLLDLDNGSRCEFATECKSDHCAGGLCCDDGDCCQNTTDCPDEHSQVSTCDMPASCQGARREAMCKNFMCGQSPAIDDDSGCTESTLAHACDAKADIFCAGGSEQEAPTCTPTCLRDEQCDPENHCSLARGCTPHLANGEICTRDGQCTSKHCQNGHCCGSGDCCRLAINCLAHAEPRVCESTTRCQGHRVDGVCNANNQCESRQVDDDSACAGEVATTCSAAYETRTLTCSNLWVQLPPSCGCSATFGGCASGYTCNFLGMCVSM